MSQDTRGKNFFRETRTADEATSLTDGVKLSVPQLSTTTTSDSVDDDTTNNSLSGPVVMPWIGYGTYKLGKDIAEECVLTALESGYRCIDTAFIYGGETTERLVGKAIHKAIEKGIISSRQDVFVTTKHWRKYHGYEQTLECLSLSLKRLSTDYVDCYLMHWPGPAWSTMHRKKEVLEKEGPWYYAADHCSDPDQMAHVRSETWRAMEDALRQGKVRAIGVSNFTVDHLKTLKQTATIWPPAVNQVECHPLYPQTELLEYCRKEGIVLQAYASLGGQDTGKRQWKKIALEGDVENEEHAEEAQNTGGQGPKQRKPKQKKLRDTVVSLLSCQPVVSVSRELNNVTPAQVLLRWALSQNCAVIPKASNQDRMVENAKALSFSLTPEQISRITDQVQAAIARAAQADDTGEVADPSALGRLTWRNEPLRLLDFE